ncbi:MAG: c-type cytochrome [Cytophagales bacterium]|nr:c-type cytochrome [Cytophagales bacterium]
MLKMSFNKLLLILIFNILYQIPHYAQAPNNVPDTLKKGVVVKAYSLKNPDAKSINEAQTDVCFFTGLANQGGIAHWQGNVYYLSNKLPALTVMESYLYIPAKKDYVFKLQAVDAATLYIDGKEVAQLLGALDFRDIDVTINLTQGYHKFVIKSLHFKRPKEYEEVSVAWDHLNQGGFDWIPDMNFYYSPTRFPKLNRMKYGADVINGFEKTMKLSEKIHPSYTYTALYNKNFTPKVGGIDFMPDGRLAVCTWDSLGRVYLVDNVLNGDSNTIKVKLIAKGLAEPLGVKVVDGKLYVLQKQELTQLIDLNGDDVTDEYKTIANSWGATGNFHEFAFGLTYKEGFFYFTLATAIQPGGKSTVPQNKDRGKVVKVGLNGSVEFVAAGLRTPNGIGLGVDNEIFVADNQGDWLPSCKIVHVTKGAFFGNYSVDIYQIGKYDEKPPVVWLPQGEIGNSASQPILLNDGPYKNQMIHGDVTHGGLKRVFVEKINNEYQGAVFHFSQGFNGGTNRICWGPDGALYVGSVGSTGNWSQQGKPWYGLEKIKHNGKSTFEMLAVRAKSNGMEIEFTQPVPAATGNLDTAYKILQWRYEPTMQYGGPKLDEEQLEIKSLSWSENRKQLFIALDNMLERRVIFIQLKNFKNIAGDAIWTDRTWYTLNNIPNEKGGLPNIVFNKLQSKNTAAPSVSKPKIPTADPYKMLNPAEEKGILAEGAKLIDPSGCLQCHKENDKVLGPAFKDIAAKYTKDPATLKKLTEKVYKGGSGVWGEQAMGANTHLKKEDIVKMVRYILSLK